MSGPPRSKWEKPERVTLAEHTPVPATNNNNTPPVTTSTNTPSSYQQHHQLNLMRRRNNSGEPVPTPSDPRKGIAVNHEHREKGFSTYFSGANEDKARERSIAQKQQQMHGAGQQGRKTKQSGGGVKVSRQQLKDIRSSMEGLVPMKAPGLVDNIVSRIHKLSDDKKTKLLSVLQQMELEGDGALPQVNWEDVEAQAGVAMDPTDTLWDSSSTERGHNHSSTDYHTDDNNDTEDTSQQPSLFPHVQSTGNMSHPRWLGDLSNSGPDLIMSVDSPVRERRPQSGRRSVVTPGGDQSTTTQAVDPFEDLPTAADNTPVPLPPPVDDILRNFQQERMGKEYNRGPSLGSSPQPTSNNIYTDP
eukprot:PhF_6_TR10402/c0_g1_i2/m.16294